MARKRTVIDSERILSLMHGGRSAEQVQAALASEGIAVSRQTVDRRMRELRGKRGTVQAHPRATARPSADEVPDEVPDGTELAVVDRWIPKVEAAAEAAELDGDLASFASLTAKLVTLLEHRRKAAPPPRVDPNEHPDMVAAARRARESLHKLVESAA